ncbi:MAG: corrinoid protein [Coriobacteriales bacterium]|jgi:corrinoid protein of di/trimethylamine methyltransferase|nr:corrinoid protein [Coriobacteriales bacterium]
MQEILQRLSDAILAMDEDAAAQLAQEAIDAGLDPTEVIDSACLDGMERVGTLFEQEEYFIPELLSSADALYAALDVLRPHVHPSVAERQRALPRVVIGSIEGDTHDIGKNVVSLILSTGGCEVRDLGRDVPSTEFVRAAQDFAANIIAISTLMTTTMERVGTVIEALRKQGLRADYLVIVGGRPLSPTFARRIGADGYAETAAGALRLVRALTADPRPKRPGVGDLIVL